MKLYRLSQKKYADNPFNPIGAKLYGGRWNSKGNEALYFSESESLCSLEVFVHINNDANMIDQYHLYRIELPDKLVVKLDHQALPANWRSIPAHENTQNIGDQFLNMTQPEHAALQVPSVISPREHNYLLNPNHPEMEEIFKQAETLEFLFDPRIFK